MILTFFVNDKFAALVANNINVTSPCTLRLICNVKNFIIKKGPQNTQKCTEVFIFCSFCLFSVSSVCSCFVAEPLRRVAFCGLLYLWALITYEVKMYKCKEIYPGKLVTIMLLSNACYYFIDWAMIVYEEEGYRLLVYYNDKLTIYNQYKSSKDAIKDFKGIYKDLDRMDRYEPQWTIPYEVEISWVNKKLRYARLWSFIKKIIRYFSFKKEYLIQKFGLEKRWNM